MLEPCELRTPVEHRFRLRPGTEALCCSPIMGSVWVAVDEVVSFPWNWWDLESEKFIRGRALAGRSYHPPECEPEDIHYYAAGHKVEFGLRSVRKERVS